MYTYVTYSVCVTQNFNADQIKILKELCWKQIMSAHKIFFFNLPLITFFAK